jgi:PQQ-like domain
VRLWFGVLAVAIAAAVPSAAGGVPQATRVGGDWTRFGYDAARHDVGPASTGITAANVAGLHRQQVGLPGTVDASPIYLRNALVHGARHDTFFMTTTYGITLAVDAAAGRILWRFTPPRYSSWAGSERITNSTPVADPSRRYVYAGAPNGRVYKLSVATGRPVWSVSITKLPSREKLGTAMNYSRGLVLATTGGYIGDAPPYQGHVAAISAAKGRIVHVWNSLCSNRHVLITPSSCASSDSAIWARSGAVVQPGTGNILVATGNGHFNGRHDWGDSALLLTRNASGILRNWTPRNQSQLDSGDVDLGSTAPALLNSTRAVQSGKDGLLRLLRLPRLGGTLGHTGGELQTISAPAGVFTTIAVWRSGGVVRIFVGTDSGTWAYVLRGGRLHVAWKRGQAGTSPVVAGSLLYVYDPDGGLNVFRPKSGSLVVRLPAGSGHWNSPIVTDGRIALPEGNANDHRTSGVLDIYR